MKGRESGMPDDTYWETFFKPRCILETLDCKESRGDVVEFGCGYGTFTLPAAQLVTGRVFALDIEPSMVAETMRKAREAGLTNVVARERDFVAEGTGLPDVSVGHAMLFNILHIENPVGLLTEARRVLMPCGKVSVIHWRRDIKTPRGPSMAIRPSPEQCREWGEQAGLRFVRFDPLSCCTYHFGLVMERP
ncbi:class I SAM-dependent methyltransferase [Singulisphaera sp. Ch08]|uniref:Class I SAM-dependent methyltransferase n=1 Tax=Singulisphaera sp. Ch08 TaxID=3120278 RepID=A0AAU7CKE6_9BACT